MNKTFFDIKNIRLYLHKLYQKSETILTYVTNILFHFLAVIQRHIIEHKKIITKILLPFLIIGGGYYACSASQRAIIRDVSDIFILSDDIRSYFSNKPDYWGLNTKFVIRNKILPRRFTRRHKVILKSKRKIMFGNGENADTVMPTMQTFDIVLPNLNKAQCISYAEAVVSDENMLKLYSIRIVNSLGNFAFEWGNNVRPLPVAKYATKDLCVKGQNTVIWTMK